MELNGAGNQATPEYSMLRAASHTTRADTARGSSALRAWPDVILPYQVILERTAMDITKDIQSMTFFRNHSAEVMQHLRATRRPMVLTVNGKAAAVVQDAEAYQHLLDLAAEANAGEGIRQGLDDLRGERTRPARAVFDALRDEYGLSR